LNDKIKNLSDDVRRGEDKVNKLGRLLFGSVDENTCGAIRELRNEFNNKINDLKTCIQDANVLQADLNEKNNELTRLKNELETVNVDISNKNKSLQKETEEKTRLKESLKIAQEQLSDFSNLKEKYDIIDKNEKKLKADLAIWEDFAKIYNPIKETIEDCQTVQSLLDEYNLHNIQDYIRVIGESIDFAKAVHEKAKQSKQENMVSITLEEKRVYSALNDCYRQVWGIDFDIFTQPNGKNVSDDFEKKEFDSSREIDLINPRDKNSKYSQELYVPLLKNRNGDIYAKAQVKAGNI